MICCDKKEYLTVKYKYIFSDDKDDNCCFQTTCLLVLAIQWMVAFLGAIMWSLHFSVDLFCTHLQVNVGFYGAERQFQHYFSYICFIGGGNWSTWRKSPTCRRSLTTFITYWCFEYSPTWAGFKLTTLVVIGTDFRHIFVNMVLTPMTLIKT